MNETSSPLADGALSLADLRALGVKPQDIDSEWMDDMTKRIFTELKRELSQLENSKPKTEHEKQDAATRALNARTLDSLQRTLERLNRMEAQRNARHSGTSKLKPADVRANIGRRVLEIIATVRGHEDPEGIDG